MKIEVLSSVSCGIGYSTKKSVVSYDIHIHSDEPVMVCCLKIPFSCGNFIDQTTENDINIHIILDEMNIRYLFDFKLLIVLNKGVHKLGLYDKIDDISIEQKKKTYTDEYFVSMNERRNQDSDCRFSVERMFSFEDCMEEERIFILFEFFNEHKGNEENVYDMFPTRLALNIGTFKDDFYKDIYLIPSLLSNEYVDTNVTFNFIVDTVKNDIIFTEISGTTNTSLNYPYFRTMNAYLGSYRPFYEFVEGKYEQIEFRDFECDGTPWSYEEHLVDKYPTFIDETKVLTTFYTKDGDRLDGKLFPYEGCEGADMRIHNKWMQFHLLCETNNY